MPEWVFWIWRAWLRLSHDRPWIGGGMGPPQPGRIPWALVMQWADRHSLGRLDAALLDHGIQAMDEVWLAWFGEEQERKAAFARATGAAGLPAPRA